MRRMYYLLSQGVYAKEGEFAGRSVPNSEADYELRLEASGRQPWPNEANDI